MGMAEEASAYAGFCASSLKTSVPRSCALTSDLISSAASTLANERDLIESANLGELSIQSIGYEVGVPDPRIHVYTTKGRAPKTAIPIMIQGHTFEVVINKVGAITIDPFKAPITGNIYFNTNGRLCCGSSCAPQREKYSGTIGALVEVDGENFILSNNHVLSNCNQVSMDMPILAPSNADGHQNAPSQAIAKLRKIVPVISGSPSFVPLNSVDIALALIPNLDLISSWQGDPVQGYDTPIVIGRPQTGIEVKKFGRTTGLTHGTLFTKQPIHPIRFNGDSFSATLWFRDVWTIITADPDEPVVVGGDSGSLVVSEDGTEALGLVFAGSPDGSQGLMISMQEIQRVWPSLRLIGSHGI